MKEIKLSNNKGIVFVDDEDYKWLIENKWHYNNRGYAQTKFLKDGKLTNKLMHHFLIERLENTEVDHIDHNKLNNQKNNLRLVTHSQNQMNMSKSKNCSSIYKGVCWNKSRNNWIVHIKKNQEQYYLGSFNNEKEAGLIYNKVAKELFGEYANLNIINIKETDNIDIEKINNKQILLRSFDRSQSQINKPKKDKCSSKYKGVCWDKSRGKWISNVKRDKKNYHLGRFKNEKEAALAYNKKAMELFGEYAYLNIIEE